MSIYYTTMYHREPSFKNCCAYLTLLDIAFLASAGENSAVIEEYEHCLRFVENKSSFKGLVQSSYSHEFLLTLSFILYYIGKLLVA
jgi:hypothetical protein